MPEARRPANSAGYLDTSSSPDGVLQTEGREVKTKEVIQVELLIITTDNLHRWGKFKVQGKISSHRPNKSKTKFHDTTCLDCSQYLYTQPAPRCIMLRRTNVFIRTKGRLQRDMRQRRRLIGLTFAKRIDDIVKRRGIGRD